MRRLVFCAFAVMWMFASTHETLAQNSLAFSKDGRVLHEILFDNPGTANNLTHVRAISYSAQTGKQLRTLNLGDTRYLSGTTDGRFGIISINGTPKDARTRVLCVDMETGRRRELPSTWFDTDDTVPDVRISGDGRLVSAYSGGPENTEVVTLYDWRTKRRIAQQSSYPSAGGFDSGGVAEDGKIEFDNNRWGARIIDPKTGADLVSYGWAIRSPNGAWIIVLPNPLNPDDSERNFQILNGMNGHAAGMLDVSSTDKDESWWWNGAFCGTLGKAVVVAPDEVIAFNLPSGKKLASLPSDTWKDPDTKETTSIACSPSGKRIAVRSGSRLTLHDLN